MNNAKRYSHCRVKCTIGPETGREDERDKTITDMHASAACPPGCVERIFLQLLNISEIKRLSRHD